MRAFALALALLSLPAAAQTQIGAVSPQLVVFAGSDANLQALANGLALGQATTLVTQDQNGLLQIVTFTPPNALSSADVARTLEQARSNLIARGITQPTAQQVATALMGGTITTTSGPVNLTGVLTNSIPQNAVQVRNEFSSAVGGTSATVPFGSANNFQALSTGLRQGTAITLTGTGTNGAPQTLTFTSPSGPLSATDTNMLLQIANQQLASLGITNPTLAQIQAALLGGTVAVTGGNVQLAGVLQNRTTSTSTSNLFGTSNNVTGTFITPGTGGNSNFGGTAGGATTTTTQPIVGTTPGVVMTTPGPARGATTGAVGR